MTLCLRPWFSLAVIICPVFFLMMTQRPPSKIKRQDKALEAYQAACAKYEKERWTPLDWIESSTKLNSKAKKTSRTQTTPWRSTTGCTTMNRLRLPANQSSLTFAQCELILLAPGLLRLDTLPFVSYNCCNTIIRYYLCKIFKSSSQLAKECFSFLNKERW